MKPHRGNGVAPTLENSVTPFETGRDRLTGERGGHNRKREDAGHHEIHPATRAKVHHPDKAEDDQEQGRYHHCQQELLTVEEEQTGFHDRLAQDHPPDRGRPGARKESARAVPQARSSWPVNSKKTSSRVRRP
jgi:hypothetical protein